MRAVTSGRDEAGAGVVLVIGLVAVLLLVATLGASAAVVVIVHRRAQAAADLSALGAAAAAQVGKDGCAAAADLAQRNGARLRSCTVNGTRADVVVEVPLPVGPGTRQLVARARAGPAGAADR